MTPEERELMNQLCQRIQTEKNTRRFTALVEQLNELLEQAHHELEPEKPKPN